MDIQRKLTSLGQKIVAVVVGAVVFILLALLMLALVSPIGPDAYKFLAIGIIPPLLSALTSAYLGGKKGGILFGVLLFLLITPITFYLMFLPLLFIPAVGQDKYISGLIITFVFPSLIFFPLGGWLGEKLYFRVHNT